MDYLSKRQAIEDLLRQGKSRREIRDALGVSRDYVRVITNKFKETSPSNKEPIASKEESKDEPKETGKPTIEVELVPKAPTQTLPPTLTMEDPNQIFNAKDLESLFMSVNSSLGKYGRSPESAELLGKAWAKPFNRLFAKYGDENLDIWIALSMTAIIYVPSGIQYIKDTSKAKKEKQKQVKIEDLMPKVVTT